ncbi:MAG: response regulator [Elusimicrobia bacterium]|nr:response regulator [Elusimicrobiota bacterium]
MSAAGAAPVLVVDDDKTTCDVISSVLAGQGYETACAGNGKEALVYLRSTSRPPRLILLDLMMPEMTGWEFRKVQQEDPALAGIPVAIITGLPDMGETAAAIGAVDVLYKPSRVETLTSIVSRFCGKA